jgi:hypothetical protein
MIRISSRVVVIALGVAAVAAVPRAASAQGDDAALRRKFSIAVPSAEMSTILQPEQFFRGAPGTNTGSVMAFGPNWGDAYIGGSYQNQTRGVYNSATKTTSANRSYDGSVSAGFGLGNSRDAVALEVDITSLSTFHSGFFNRTAFSFKLNRMLDDYSAIAVGVENGFIAGPSPTDGTASWYAVASRVFLLPGASSNDVFKAVTASFGLGNGRFRFIQDVATNKSTVNAFASAALLIVDQVSVIADYTGQDFDVGLSLVPFRQLPIVITPALSDVTGTASKTMRFTLGVGIGMHF